MKRLILRFSRESCLLVSEQVRKHTIVHQDGPHCVRIKF